MYFFVVWIESKFSLVCAHARSCVRTHEAFGGQNERYDCFLAKKNLCDVGEVVKAGKV